MVWGWQVDSEELASVIGAHLGGEAALDGVSEGVDWCHLVRVGLCLIRREMEGRGWGSGSGWGSG